jgi:hypothetical protein
MTDAEKAKWRADHGLAPLEAQVFEFPDRLSEQELIRRQAALDAAWERTLEARREYAARWDGTWHKGPGDPDWKLR